MQDFRTKETVKVVQEIQQFVEHFGLPKLDDNAIKVGLQQSKTTCAQLPYVFATPLMKNLLVYFGDVKQYQEGDEWKTEKLPTGQKSKAVDFVNDIVHAALRKFNGPEKHSYEVNRDVFDPEHYNVDCWNSWKPEIWDIQPGQAKSRAETFMAYEDPKTNYTYAQLMSDLYKDECLQLAIKLFLAYWPEVCAARDVHDVSDPFKHKGTGTSYPDYRNDATIAPDSQETYGQLCVREVTNAFNKGMPYFINWMKQYLVYTGYPRNQRGKGRALEAMSRRYNIGINILNSVEMEKIKTLNFGTGLKSEQEIKKDLIALGQYCRSLGPDYGVFNLDATQWDYNLGWGVLLLQHALRTMKTNGDKGKTIALLRAAGNYKAWFVDGPNNRVKPIYGRQESGYDDTTLGNTASNRLLSIAGAIKTDRNYSRIYYGMDGGTVITLGDDLEILLKKKEKDNFCKYMSSKGIKLHNDEKDAYGLFFVQYRVVEEEPGKFIIMYSWPRVLRSTLSKENQKSLGKYGWTLAWYQQIGKCRENRTALMILTSIVAAFDKDHLSLDTPIREIIDGAKKEDDLKQASQKGNRQKALTTAEVLSGGNPQALGVTAEGKLDANFFEEIQTAMRTSYNPHLLEDLGFKTPDLSKVH